MQLFIIESNIAKPVTETLLLPPFLRIWEQDRSPRKDEATRIFCYIEFLCSPKRTNPFSGYSDDIRESEIKKVFFPNEDFQPSEDVKECISLYKQFLYEASPSLRFLQSAKSAASKLQNFFDTVDINEKNPKSGMPMWKPKEISSALTDAFNVIKTLNAIQEKVDQELYEVTKTKGNRRINPFERSPSEK